MNSNEETHTKPAVLIIEDDFANARLLYHYLSGDYTVYHSPDAADALRKLYIHHIDVISLDMSLKSGVMNGYQFLDYFKLVGKFNHIKVIAVTGRSEDEIKEHFSFDKLNAFLQKPVEKEIFQGTIRKVLADRVES